MIRILHYIPDLGRGGAETQLVENVLHLDPERFASVVCFGGPADDYVATLEHAGVPVVQIGVPGNIASLRPAWKLAQVARKHKADIIHVGLFPNRTGLLGAALARRPAVTTLPRTYDWTSDDDRSVGAAGRSWKSRLMFNAQVALAKRVSRRFVAISDAVRVSAAKQLGIPDERMTIIHRAVVAEEFAPPTDHETRNLKGELGIDDAYPVMVNVARLVPVKGHKELLSAMPAILRALPKAKLIFAGDGPERSALAEQAQQLGIADSVLFIGNRDDVPAVLNVADIFVFGSFFEGFGTAVVEAMAAGLPVVAFRLPSLEEIVEDGLSGMLIDDRDEARFAEVVVQLASDPERIQAMGSRGQEITREKFDIRRTIRELETLYEKVLLNTRTRKRAAVACLPSKHKARPESTSPLPPSTGNRRPL